MELTHNFSGHSTSSNKITRVSMRSGKTIHCETNQGHSGQFVTFQNQPESYSPKTLAKLEIIIQYKVEGFRFVPLAA